MVESIYINIDHLFNKKLTKFSIFIKNTKLSDTFYLKKKLIKLIIYTVRLIIKKYLYKCTCGKILIIDSS